MPKSWFYSYLVVSLFIVQIINVDQLLPLCHLDAIYNKTIEFSIAEEVHPDREIKMDFTVLQGKNESSISAITCFKDVSSSYYIIYKFIKINRNITTVGDLQSIGIDG